MSELVPRPDLADLARQIKEEHDRAEHAARPTPGHAPRAGALLLEAQDQCQRGQKKWGAWLKANVPFSGRTARVYMQVARERERLNSAAAADLGLGEALKLLGDADRQAAAAAAVERARVPEEHRPQAVEHVLAQESTPGKMAGAAKDYWYDASGRRSRDIERARKQAKQDALRRQFRDGDLKGYLTDVGEKARELTHKISRCQDAVPYYESASHKAHLHGLVTALQARLDQLEKSLKAPGKPDGTILDNEDSGPNVAEVVDP
jgi:hypothetical protein